MEIRSSLALTVLVLSVAASPARAQSDDFCPSLLQAWTAIKARGEPAALALGEGWLCAVPGRLGVVCTKAFADAAAARAGYDALSAGAAACMKPVGLRPVVLTTGDAPSLALTAPGRDPSIVLTLVGGRSVIVGVVPGGDTGGAARPPATGAARHGPPRHGPAKPAHPRAPTREPSRAGARSKHNAPRSHPARIPIGPAPHRRR